MTPSATSTQLEDHPHVVKTTLNYYLDPALGGHSSFELGTAGYFRRSFDERPIQIQDIRGREWDFSLKKHGFQHLKHASIEKDFTDDEKVKSVVYPETEKLLKQVTGATRVHVFSHITRRSSRDKVEAAVRASTLADDVKISDVTPARYIHIDQSNQGALEVLTDNLPSDVAEKLLQTRWSIINVWRPIKPISKDPLGVCDARSVRDEDLIPVSANLPPKGSMSYGNLTMGRRFETLYAKYQPEHEWYYASAMTPEEVLLIKCFDSIRDGETARRVPHSAFTDPETANDVTRESIEIRCLVFYEDQPNE